MLIARQGPTIRKIRPSQTTRAGWSGASTARLAMCLQPRPRPARFVRPAHPFRPQMRVLIALQGPFRQAGRSSASPARQAMCLEPRPRPVRFARPASSSQAPASAARAPPTHTTPIRAPPTSLGASRAGMVGSRPREPRTALLFLSFLAQINVDPAPTTAICLTSRATAGAFVSFTPLPNAKSGALEPKPPLPNVDGWAVYLFSNGRWVACGATRVHCMAMCHIEETKYHANILARHVVHHATNAANAVNNAAQQLFNN